jgi:hypothetical protein
MAQQEVLVGRLKNKKASPVFNRPSIDLSPIKREWKNVAAKDLKENDIIGGKGLIQDVAFRLPSSVDDEQHVMITTGLDVQVKVYFFAPDDEVFAFVRKE